MLNRDNSFFFFLLFTVVNYCTNVISASQQLVLLEMATKVNVLKMQIHVYSGSHIQLLGKTSPLDRNGKEMNTYICMYMGFLCICLLPKVEWILSDFT